MGPNLVSEKTLAKERSSLKLGWKLWDKSPPHSFPYIPSGEGDRKQPAVLLTAPFKPSSPGHITQRRSPQFSQSAHRVCHTLHQDGPIAKMLEKIPEAMLSMFSLPWETRKSLSLRETTASSKNSKYVKIAKAA